MNDHWTTKRKGRVVNRCADCGRLLGAVPVSPYPRRLVCWPCLEAPRSEPLIVGAPLADRPQNDLEWRQRMGLSPRKAWRPGE